MMLSWRDEMDNMLGVFDRQAKMSLNNIRMAFKRGGFLLNADFKQYFLRATNDRLKLTYDQFEFDATLEGQFDFGVDVEASMGDGDNMLSSIETHGINEVRQQDWIEMIDSDDEDDDNVNQIKLENASVIHEHRIKRDADKAMELDERDVEVCIPFIVDRDHTPTNPHRLVTTKKTTSNNQSNVVDDVARVQSRLTPRSLGNKKPSNQFEVQKRFKCTLCEYSSNHKWNFDVHMRTHSGVKPYQCNICGKKFTRMEQLKKHKVTHTEQVPFHCRGCLNGYSQKIERDAHEKVCKKRRYECHICKKYVNASKFLLKRHMSNHNGEKPFRCQICMARFTEKGSLKKHLDTIHTRINP